jgi:hypothetical protein
MTAAPQSGEPRTDVICLRLNDYEAANLLHTLKAIWRGDLKADNSGDWCGEIPQQLEALMRAKGWEQKAANSGDMPCSEQPEAKP